MDRTCVLIVDDEPKLVRLVNEVLSATGHKVISTGKGEVAIKMAAMEQPDLILLDIILAGEVDGYEVARRVREFSDVPIIMLTAKTREIDLLKGFNAGADDYLTKPFSSKELLVRLEAVLRRSRRETGEPVESEIGCGRMRIDLARRRVTVDGDDVHLSKTEYNLLYELAKHRNQVVLHAQLLGAVWGPEYRDDLEYLRAYIRYLRKKLEFDPSNPQMIVTCQGVGYMLDCPVGSE
ncbi:MAG: response regulator [Anaerolineales bacterium]|nr:response regulator [Anaerolineales bacterium]